MNYFLWIDGKEHGPYTLEKIRAAIEDGRIDPLQTARTEDSANWAPLDTIANLTTQKSDKPLASKTATSPTAAKSPSAPSTSHANMRYTNALLTIIAVCLLIQVQPILFPKALPSAHASPNTLDVRIVGVLAPLDVNLATVGTDKLSRVGGQVVLPVGVHNTVETKVISPVFGGLGTNFQDGIGVVILNK